MKKPPIVNAVTLCVNHNLPDHKWVLDIEAYHGNLEWSPLDRTYYTKEAIKDYYIVQEAHFKASLKKFLKRK